MSSPVHHTAMPEGLQIGDRFLLQIDAPDLGRPQFGRLQDLSAEGALCIDVPPDVSAPRGTRVTVRGVRSNRATYSFSSEILGRGRIDGRLPVLLVRAPTMIDEQQRRTSYRISVALRAQVEWTADDGRRLNQPAVVTNLSGGGAQVFVRRPVEGQQLWLSLTPPPGFVTERGRRQVAQRRSAGRTVSSRDPLADACDRIRCRFSSIPVTLIRSRRLERDTHGVVHALSVAFAQPHDACYRLVRYLERQAAQRGVTLADDCVATAA